MSYLKPKNQVAKIAVSLLLLLPCFLFPARAGEQLTGYVDSLSAQGAVGWACVPGTSQSTSIEIFAGYSLLGVFPASEHRPDTQGVCGNSATGFAAWFDPVTQQQFYGATSLAAYAVTRDGKSILLTASNPKVANPTSILAGYVLGLDAEGRVTGTISSLASSPVLVDLFAGGPYNGAGLLSGEAKATRSGQSTLDFSVPDAQPDQPTFAYVKDASGVKIPLLTVLPKADATSLATPIPLKYVVAQAGSQSGIRNTIFSKWVLAGMGFAGVSGQITFSGNQPAFSEALVSLGSTNDDAATCAELNNSTPGVVPSFNRLWAAILKNNLGAGHQVSIPVSFALPHPESFGASASGECFITVISAGYAFLDPNTPRYTKTIADLTMWAEALPPLSSAILTLGLGGEFKFTTGGPQSASTVVGIVAQTALLVDGIAGSVSASGIVGAPAQSGWLPAPSWLWTINTDFYAFPAATCAQIKIPVRPASPLYSVMRQGTAGPFSPPPGSASVLHLSAMSMGPTAIQRTAYQTFGNVESLGVSPLVLNAGDCLLAVHTLPAGSFGPPGQIDFENQSNVYIRPSR